MMLRLPNSTSLHLGMFLSIDNMFGKIIFRIVFELVNNSASFAFRKATEVNDFFF